jgi:hypothetical protein
MDCSGGSTTGTGTGFLIICGGTVMTSGSKYGSLPLEYPIFHPGGKISARKFLSLHRLDRLTIMSWTILPCGS